MALFKLKFNTSSSSLPSVGLFIIGLSKILNKYSRTKISILKCCVSLLSGDLKSKLCLSPGFFLWRDQHELN